MRKLSLAMMCLAIAGLMTMVSCRKPNTFNGKKLTFKATIDNNGAKTTLHEVEDGTEVLWTSGDAISINGEEFTLKGTGGSTSGEFEGAEVKKVEGNYFASYPYSTEDGYTNNGSSVKFHIDANQSLYGNLNGMIPMVACVQEKDASLTFKNMVNILKLDLQGYHTITNIEVVSTDESLNGDFTVSSATLTASGVDEGTNSITVTPVPPIVLNTSDIKTVYVMLPVFSSADHTISVNFTTSESGVKTVGPIALKNKDVSGSGSNTPSHVYTLAVQIQKESITSQLQSFEPIEYGYPVNP